MHIDTGQKKHLTIVISILLAATLLDQFLISKIIPWLSGLLSINPILVILGVPVSLPVTFGLIPVFAFFMFFYSMAIAPYHFLHDPATKEHARKKFRKVVSGVFAIPFCILLSGLIYAVMHDWLPKNLRNAFESMGLNADLHTYLPGDKTIHFRGSIFILTGFFCGIYIFMKKIKTVSQMGDYIQPGPEKPLGVVKNNKKQLQERDVIAHNTSLAKNPKPRRKYKPLDNQVNIPS